MQEQLYFLPPKSIIYCFSPCLEVKYRTIEAWYKKWLVCYHHICLLSQFGLSAKALPAMYLITLWCSSNCLNSTICICSSWFRHAIHLYYREREMIKLDSTIPGSWARSGPSKNVLSTIGEVKGLFGKTAEHQRLSKNPPGPGYQIGTVEALSLVYWKASYGSQHF